MRIQGQVEDGAPPARGFVRATGRGSIGRGVSRAAERAQSGGGPLPMPSNRGPVGEATRSVTVIGSSAA